MVFGKISDLGPKIEAELEKYPQGIWTSELARKIGIKRPTLIYHLFGQTKNGRKYGADVPVERISRKIGTEILVKLKKKK